VAKIEFMNKPPPNAAQVIMLDAAFLSRVGCISVDNVAFVFTNSAEATAPEPVRCSITEADSPARRGPKGKKLLRQIDLFHMRAKTGANSVEWAEQLGVAHQTVERLERLKPISATTIQLIEEKLGVALDPEVFLDPDRVPAKEKRQLEGERKHFTHKLRGKRAKASKEQNASA
jgi:DNA-binding Xre family transcriptional regulator